jgi:hypothetical protein
MSIPACCAASLRSVPTGTSTCRTVARSVSRTYSSASRMYSSAASSADLNRTVAVPMDPLLDMRLVPSLYHKARIPASDKPRRCERRTSLPLFTCRGRRNPVLATRAPSDVLIRTRMYSSALIRAWPLEPFGRMYPSASQQARDGAPPENRVSDVSTLRSTLSDTLSGPPPRAARPGSPSLATLLPVPPATPIRDPG